MSEFEVAIKIAGKLDKSLQTSVSSAQKMLGSLGKGGLSSALTGIGNTMESTGKALTTGVTMPVIALGATSVKEFGSVDKSMKLVQATMGSTDAQAKQLESTMKKAAANSVFGMQDAADATLNFARQGFNAKQAGDMLTPALNLAAGTATDLSVVTGGLGNALKMFGKDSNYAATAADILSTAQAQANTTVTDLFDAMATAGPICSSVGWSMSDLAAITDIFGDAGISGAEGATALKTGLARLASPAKDGATWIKKLGLEIFNSDGSMKSMVDVQKQLHDSFQGLTSQEQMSAAAAIFGKNQMAKWMTLINASPDQVQKYASSLEGAAGSSQKMADALLSGMGGSLEKLNSSFDVMKYTVGGIASEVLKPFVDNLTGLIDKFNNLDPSMQKNIVKWVGIAAAAGPVLLIGGRLFKMAGSLVGTFGKVGKAIGSIGKKTKGMSAPLKEGSSVMSAAAKNALGFGIGFAAAAAGVWILVKAAKELAAAGPGAQIATVLMAGGIIALMAVAAQLAPKLQAGTQGLLAFGGAILMAGAGMSLMAMAATQVAAAGPMAFASLALMEGGIIALLAVAGAMGPQLAGASAGLLVFGGAVLMAAAGMSLMAMAATQVAAAGPMAIAALAIMEVGMIAMMAVAGALGPALTAASVGLIAFGASIVLAATGCLIMVQAATQIASAGPAAQIALALLAAGLIAFGAIAGALAPILLAGAAAIAALGAALTLVATAAMLGAAALAIISVSLPLLSTYGATGASAILTLSGALTAFAASAAICGAGALAAAAGLLAMAAGATAGGTALLILAAGALAASVGMVPLAAALALAAASVEIIGASAKAAGSALKSMAKGATGTAAKMAIIAAGAAPLAAALAPLAVAAAAAAAAVLALAAGSTAAAAAIMLLAAGITMTARSADTLQRIDNSIQGKRGRNQRSGNANSGSIHKDGSGSGTVHRSDHSAGRTDDGNISIHGRICRRHHSSGSFSNRAGRIPAVDNGNTWNARSFNYSSNEYGHSGHQKLHDTVEPGRGNRNHRDADNNADRNDNHRGRDQKRHDHVRGGGQNRRKPGSGSMQKHKQPDGRSFLRTFRKHVQRRIIRDGRTQEWYRSRWSCSDRPGEKHSQPGSSNRQQRSEDSLSIKSPGSIRTVRRPRSRRRYPEDRSTRSEGSQRITRAASNERRIQDAGGSTVREPVERDRRHRERIYWTEAVREW